LTTLADVTAIVIGGGGMAVQVWHLWQGRPVDAGIMIILAGLLAGRTALGIYQLRPSPGASGTPESQSPSTPPQPPAPSSSPSTAP